RVRCVHAGRNHCCCNTHKKKTAPSLPSRFLDARSSQLLAFFIVLPRMTAVQASGAKAVRQKIWWSNAVFFVGVHVATVIGVYYRPPWLVKPATLVFAFLVWQLADFGYDASIAAFASRL